MVELVLAKDWVRVRFPAPAQYKITPMGLFYNVHSVGIEPTTTVPKTVVISISPRVRELLNDTFKLAKNQKI